MATTRIAAAQDLFLNASKTVAVRADSPDAAFLLIRKNAEVPRQWEHLVTRTGNPKRRRATKEVKPGEDK